MLDGKLIELVVIDEAGRDVWSEGRLLFTLKSVRSSFCRFFHLSGGIYHWSHSAANGWVRQTELPPSDATVPIRNSPYYQALAPGFGFAE